MLKIGDFVTRKSYNNDIIFIITKIINNTYYLKGVNVRLYADSSYNDLVLCDNYEDDSFVPNIDDYRVNERNEYFYLPGKILHIDGSKEYLAKCLDFYRKYNLRAFGKYLNEFDFKNEVRSLLEQYKPNILVLTGHDSFSNKEKSHKNSGYFSDAIKEARKFENSHDKLLIVAGACQSNYEVLIKSGANFASSPKGVNIHALDPAIVAVCLAFSNINQNIDLINILNKTKYGSDGIGGIITKGTMYIGYPR